ncbi:M23 family metallopeptidase [Fulvimarina sp. 2208YS6-2-32]|uniref:M23 family metallopeptidase n=1 Tax=Fulvimarina uroteuthidis TaxID=3098149 RepID=A0ABU5HWX2_9HYPH|nr:M23 family metallopeptidase [Fulvimarina sp. 2208YS6-2-32]
MKATAVFLLSSLTVSAAGIEAASAGGPLGVPVACEAGRTCFVQQYADMDAGAGVADPFCGAASYNGHKGTDIRIPAMSDIRKNVPVLALKAGTVLRTRDTEEDRPVLSPAEWPKFSRNHCGNGLIIDHGDGLEVQYCHLRKGSLQARAGDKVRAGETIGAVGSSGMAAFPHLHLTVRRHGIAIDPFTGRSVGTGCQTKGEGEPLWSRTASAFLDRAAVHTMAIGVSGAAPDYHRLMLDGVPPDAKPSDRATIGWGWFLNLRKGDRLRFTMTAPDGSNALERTSKPLRHRKAAYLQFVGRGGPPAPGRWTLTVDILRKGRAIETKTVTVAVDAERPRPDRRLPRSDRISSR